MPKRPSKVTSSSTSGAGAPAAGGTGHSRLVLAEPPRDAGLEQLHDLTWRPGVDVRYGEGFRTPAIAGRASGHGAGVRKPPKHEPAGHRCDVMGI